MTLYQGRKEQPGSSVRKPLPWMFEVARWTLLGGIVAALLALVLGQKGWALGFFAGGLLSVLNFFFLKSLVEKNMTPEGATDQRRFWFWNAARWGACVLFCWLLLSVSIACLFGALISYLWFLGVLTWVGLRTNPKG